ncbi:hypothetical protein GQ457_18G015770 [Hibiscus cannabinus]
MHSFMSLTFEFIIINMEVYHGKREKKQQVLTFSRMPIRNGSHVSDGNVPKRTQNRNKLTFSGAVGGLQGLVDELAGLPAADLHLDAGALIHLYVWLLAILL